MDDIQLIRGLRPDTRLPEPDELASVRAPLAAAMAAEQPITRRAPRSRRPWRWQWAAGLSGALAAAVAAAVAVAVAVLPGNPDPGPPLRVDAEAARVLTGAAAAALKLPDQKPRPDQFLYRRMRWTAAPEREVWQSVDGTRDGLEKFTRDDGKPGQQILYGCRDGRQPVQTGEEGAIEPGRTQECTPDPAYLPDLPTDADGMLAYLAGTGDLVTGDPHATGKNISHFAATHYLRPQARAAFFAALARIPGLHVVPGLTDGGGRVSVGVMWSYAGPAVPGATATDREYGMLFDPQSYAFNGFRSGGEASAVLQVGFVDKVGQRP
ncbi:MAG TPA: CU044_5270 family protein [Catenuloplanes sp.]|jgi:hypothetical protein